MDSKDLRALLENEPNKLNIFGNRELLHECSMSVSDLFSLIQDFLTDEEKLTLFKYPHFQSLSKSIRVGILKRINDDFVKFKALILPTNKDFDKDDFKEIVEKSSENLITKILEHKEVATVLFHFTNSEVCSLMKNLSDDVVKKNLMNIYQLEDLSKLSIIKTFDTQHKLEEVKQDNISASSKISLLRTLDSHELVQFISENKDFLNKDDIKIYNIIDGMDNESQLEFVKHLEETNMTFNEKREVLALVDGSIKDHLDLNDFPEEYITALEMKKTSEFSEVIDVDLDKDLEIYKGLDNIISICPENFDEKQRASFLKLCDICPNMDIISDISGFQCYSTPSEYKEAEAWIGSVLEKLKPEYSDVQKIAIIDSEYGKRTSYSPNFKTETYNDFNSRALWKMLSKNEFGGCNGGVCNGHAHAVEYICKRAGIQNVKLVSGANHTFLKLEDIEIPLSNGETIKGNTILDPTWNLTNNRFGAKPDNFCISYKTIRKHDIDIYGNDKKCHFNDDDLKDATLELDEKSLRQIFSSVGLADKDGVFPITNTIKKSEEIDKLYANQPKQNIKEQLLLLEKICPEFATCPNSSMRIISDILLCNENLDFDRCITNRVYDKEDENKVPVLYVYVKSQDMGEVFFHASMEEGKFEESSRMDFEKRFQCYDVDLENGLPPWNLEEKQEEQNLTASSGDFVEKEEDER